MWSQEELHGSQGPQHFQLFSIAHVCSYIVDVFRACGPQYIAIYIMKSLCAKFSMVAITLNHTLDARVVRNILTGAAGNL